MVVCRWVFVWITPTSRLSIQCNYLCEWNGCVPPQFVLWIPASGECPTRLQSWLLWTRQSFWRSTLLEVNILTIHLHHSSTWGFKLTSSVNTSHQTPAYATNRTDFTNCFSVFSVHWFLLRCIYAGRSFRSRFCLSVRPSVRLSVKRMYCDGNVAQRI